MTGLISIFKLVKWYRRNNIRTPEEIGRLQTEKLKSLVLHARENSPFFRKLYSDIDLKNLTLSGLPVIDRETVIENFEDYLTVRGIDRGELEDFVLNRDNIGKKFKDKYIAFHTSGTSGPPLLLLYSEEAFNHVKAIIFARGTPVEPSLYRLLKCIFWKRPRHAIILMDGGLYPAITNALYLPPFHWLVFDIKIISIFRDIEDIVKELNDFDPWFITGYPHILARIAGEKRSGRLSIFKDTPAKRIMSVSEPLTPSARSQIEEAFDTPVIDHYGTGECLPMARDCYEERRMHINSDMCILEVVNRENEPVQPGEKGEKVLVTNLFNPVQPFIRYAVNDVVALSSEPCPCGLPFPVIEAVEGKTDEVFLIRDKPVHPCFFVEPLGRFFQVQEYRVEYLGGNRIEIVVDPARGEMGLPLDEIERSVRSSIERVLPSGQVEIRAKVGPVRPDPETGKVRRFVDKAASPGS